MQNRAQQHSAGAPSAPAIWSLDIRNGGVVSSSARAAMLGYEPAAAQASQSWWDALVHPDDRARLDDARSRLAQPRDSAYRCEYRARRRDGSFAMLLEVGSLTEAAPDGSPLRAGGVLLDLTPEREAQFRTQQRLQRLSTVFDNSYQFSGLLSPQGILVETNRTSLQAAGVTLDDVIGKPYWQTAFWQTVADGELAELRGGVARAAEGEFVRFEHKINPPGQSMRYIDFSLRPVKDDSGKVVWILPEGRDITEIILAQQALRTAEKRLEVATGSANIGLWDIDLGTGHTWFNDRWWTMLGYQPDGLKLSREIWESMVHPDDIAATREQMDLHVATGNAKFDVEFRMRHRDGSWRWIRSLGSSVPPTGAGEAPHVAGVHLDITDHKDTEMRLATAERLESVGKLAAGIAHEINTPVQYVSDSIYFVKAAVAELLQLTEAFGGQLREEQRLAAASKLGVDVSYLTENLPKALERAADGLQRVTEIVRAMKDFAHPDQPKMTEVDLNRAIHNTLAVAANEYRLVAEIDTELAPLPPVRCHAGEINQVLLNLIVNAAHAIADAVKGTGRMGRITVGTRLEDECVVISVGDTGVGIPEGIRHRIFEPFFTTKDVGRGSGQGLAIVHSIVVKRHRGSLTFHTELGRGTVFEVRLPLDSHQQGLSQSAAA